jgi:hypothetical protein
LELATALPLGDSDALLLIARRPVAETTSMSAPGTRILRCVARRGVVP